MKILKVFCGAKTSLLILLCCMLNSQITSTLVCKKAILQSFGMTGLAKANKDSQLCPKNSHNCCSKMDQMKIHKLWSKDVKNLVVGNYKINTAALALLKNVVADRKTMDFEKIVVSFEKKNKPNKFFKDKMKVYMAKFKKFTHKAVSDVRLIRPWEN